MDAPTLDPVRVPLRRSAPSASRSPGPILAMTIDLAEDLENVDLDEVDGEFYWRCCRTDLHVRLAELCSRRPRPIGARKSQGEVAPHSDDDLEGLVEPSDPVAFLREGLRYANELLDLADRATEVFPSTVWPRILDGERIAMRAVSAEVHGPRTPGSLDHTLYLKVFSGAWTGEQVEDEIRRQVQKGSRWLVLPPERAGTGVYVRVGFSLARDLEAAGGETEAAGSPHVAICAELPLPPPGAIAREYDALVRRERQWHLLLPGGGSRQDKEVAIRTWAVAMLMTEGMVFGDAMAEVHRVTGFGDVSQARFGQDRTRLLERVPEAEPYLFARRTGVREAASARNSAIRERLANRTGTEVVANGGSSAAPLQHDAADEATYT